jgi:hypothetical protein
MSSGDGMDTGPILALEPLSTIVGGEVTDTPALCSIHFSFLFMEENCIP